MNFTELMEVMPELKAFMKTRGYRKRNKGWTKTNNGVSIAVSVQKSSWNHQVFYINYGVTVVDIINVCSFNATDYPIRERLEGKNITFDQLLYSVNLWEEKYDSLVKIARAAIEDKLPPLSDARIVSSLSSGDYLLQVLDSTCRGD